MHTSYAAILFHTEFPRGMDKCKGGVNKLIITFT